jgi:hypothetical protein
MTTYIYDYAFSEHGTGDIEVAIYDPEKGCGRFGYEARVQITQDWKGEGAPYLVARVGQGSIGAVTADLARLREDVFARAIAIAETFQALLDDGDEINERTLGLPPRGAEVDADGKEVTG